MKHVRVLTTFTLIGLVAVLPGCGGDKSGDGDVAAKNKKADTQQKSAASQEQLNAAHILIQYRGCDRAIGVTRSREEARAIAEEVLAKTKAADADFDALALEYSEDPSSTSGGNMGNFKPDQMVGQFVTATRALKVGEISDVVETQFGFHIIKRKEVAETYNAAHILVMHKDAKMVPDNVPFTRAEAMAIAKEIYKICTEEDGNFSELAEKHSHGPARNRGGHMGNFTLAELPSYFGKVGEVCSSLEIGEVSEPFETDFGVHLVKRQEIPGPPKVYGAKHVLVMHKDSARAPKSISRSREDALKRIQMVRKQLDGGAKFEQMAADYSDCPSSEKGGDLGKFSEKRMPPTFSQATDACEVGKYTDIIESPFGFHIIYRYQ